MAEVYGTNLATLEDARDKLYTKLQALVVAMQTGYNPKLSYAYPRHLTIPTRLNAVSIDFVGCDTKEEGTSGGGKLNYQYLIHFTARVHSAHEGQFHDNIKTMRLLNSINNYLFEKADLANGYIIYDIDKFVSGQHFAETATQGGEMTVTIKTFVEHERI